MTRFRFYDVGSQIEHVLGSFSSGMSSKYGFSSEPRKDNEALCR